MVHGCGGTIKCNMEQNDLEYTEILWPPRLCSDWLVEILILAIATSYFVSYRDEMNCEHFYSRTILEENVVDDDDLRLSHDYAIVHWFQLFDDI